MLMGIARAMLDDPEFRVEALKVLLPDLIKDQNLYEANFFGYRPTVAVTPFVKEPLLLVPTDGEQLFENYVRNRFGGQPSTVFRRSSKAIFESLGEDDLCTSVDDVEEQSHGSRL